MDALHSFICYDENDHDAYEFDDAYHVCPHQYARHLIIQHIQLQIY